MKLFYLWAFSFLLHDLVELEDIRKSLLHSQLGNQTFLFQFFKTHRIEKNRFFFFQYHWIQSLIVIFILQPSDHMWLTEYGILLSTKSHYEARLLPLDCDTTVDLEDERFKTVIATDTDGLSPSEWEECMKPANKK